MVIKLTQQQFDYLKNNFLNKKGWQKLPLHIKKESQIIFIEIGDNAADEIRDWAIDKQSQNGFDEDYELNREGVILEELIDIFFTSN